MDDLRDVEGRKHRQKQVEDEFKKIKERYNVKFGEDKIYIAEIGEYKHHMFMASYWSSDPCMVMKRKLVSNDNVELATAAFKDWCKKHTEEVNKKRIATYKNYNKDDDESIFKVVEVYSTDDIEDV